MTKMNESQESLLSQLEGARLAYERFESNLAQEVADRKWEAKAELRELVREARLASVPYRQIGFAVGSSDHKTIKDYEANVRRDI